MIWEKPMKADGHEATAEQLQAAWDRWIASRASRTTGLLQRFLTAAGAGNEHSSWRCVRMADRMVQRARKAGEITFLPRVQVWALPSELRE